MGANTAGIYGAQIFRADDRPKYRRGFSINIGVLSLALTLATVRFIDDRLRARRARGRQNSVTESDSSSSEEQAVDASLPAVSGEKASGNGYRQDVKASEY
jgi:hypothetical protein